MRDTVELRPTFLIEAAQPEDLKGIAAVERDGFYPQDRYPKGVFKRLITQADDPLSGLSLLVARDPIAGGRSGLAGYALGMRQENGSSALLLSIAVAPLHRGLGIGWDLVRGISRALEAPRVSLHVDTFNKAAVRAYERQGFEHNGRVPDYYAPGRDALSMSRGFDG